MKCDRCEKETTTYKYLNKNYCYHCNWAIYAHDQYELEKFLAHLERIDEKLHAWEERTNLKPTWNEYLNQTYTHKEQNKC